MIKTTEKVTSISTARSRRRHAKRGQIINGAREVFMMHGYEGASVDQIADHTRASKATLYNYFADKSELFRAVMERECEALTDQVFLDLPHGPIEEVLTQVASRFCDLIFSPSGQDVFRTCIAEASRFPELGHLFYISGPQIFAHRLAVLLRDARRRGELEVADPVLAAHQFSELCRTELFIKRLCGSDIPKAQLDLVKTEAVTMFMARYRAAFAPDFVTPLRAVSETSRHP